MPGVDLEIDLKLDDSDVKAIAAAVQSQINAGLGGVSLPKVGGGSGGGGAGGAPPKGIGPGSRLDSYFDDFSDGADQASHRIEALQGDLAGLAGQIEAQTNHLNNSLSELVAVEKFEKFRSWLSDVRDAFDITAQSLLGFSDKEAKAASEAAYLVEKGLAVGGAFGPWGAAIGGVGGALIGLIHYMRETDDTAEKLHETMQKQIADAKEMQALWGILNEKQKEIQKESESTSQGFFLLSERIRNTLNPQEMPKGAQALKEEIDTLKSSLETTSDSASELGREVEKLQAQADILRATENPGQAKLDELSDIEGELAEKRKILEQSTKNLEPVLSRYNELQAESARRVKESTGEQKKLNEEVEKFFRLFDSSATRAADAFWQRELDQMDEITQAFSNPPDTNLNDNLLGFMGREAEETRDKLVDLGLVWDEVKKEFVEIGALPSLQSILGDATGLDFDPLMLKLMETLNVSQELAEGIRGIGQEFASSIGGTAADAVDLLFDRIATGEKAAKGTFGRMVADFLRQTGHQLIADGVKNELVGLGQNLILPGSGSASVALGGLEIGTGIAMGASGALLQRRVGPAPEGGSPGRGLDGGNHFTSADRAASGPQSLTPIVINFNSTVPYTERQAQEAAAGVQGMLDKGRRGRS